MSVVTVFNNVAPEDVTITPFRTHKSWEVDELNSGSFGLMCRNAIYRRDLPKIGTADDRLSDVQANLTYYSINHLFYKRKNNPYDVFESTLKRYVPRYLGEKAVVISVPQEKYGESIKRKSINISDRSKAHQGITINLKDDGYGNLYDAAINTGSLVSDSSSLMAYWGFNDNYLKKNRINATANVHDGGKYQLNGVATNVYFTDGVTTTGVQTTGSGICAMFNGSASIRIPHFDRVNFHHDQNFSISFFIKLPISQSDASGIENVIMEKYGMGKGTVLTPFKGRTETVDVPIENNIYPFSISTYNHTAPANDRHKIIFRQSSGRYTAVATSSALTPGQWYHITVNSSDDYSILQLYVNNTNYTAPTRKFYDLDTSNKADIFIGGRKGTERMFSGSLDEIRIYNRSLSQGEIKSLNGRDYTSGSMYNTNVVGNAFYTNGFLVVTSPMPVYNNVMKGVTDMHYNRGFDFSFKGTHTIYEWEVLCRTRPSDFNSTSNPTIRMYNDPNQQMIQDFANEEDWRPYITTIGLYDDKGRLLATGKLSRPIQKRNDVDMNFVIKFDQ